MDEISEISVISVNVFFNNRVTEMEEEEALHTLRLIQSFRQSGFAFHVAKCSCGKS